MPRATRFLVFFMGDFAFRVSLTRAVDPRGEEGYARAGSHLLANGRARALVPIAAVPHNANAHRVSREARLEIVYDLEARPWHLGNVASAGATSWCSRKSASYLDVYSARFQLDVWLSGPARRSRALSVERRTFDRIYGKENVPDNRVDHFASLHAKVVKSRLHNILNYYAHGITNAVSEGINFAIQTIKKRAGRYRNVENFKTAIYFHCGGLDLYPAR